MIDDWVWIGIAKRHTTGGEDEGRGRPGFVDVSSRKFCEFGDPAADVGPVRVEFRALQSWVEDAEIGGGVGTAAGHPLPACGVAGEIGIDEGVPEPSRASLPGDQQVFDEERRRYHADAVVHPACVPELAHAGIDDGVSCLAALPCQEAADIVAIGEARVFGFEGLFRQGWPVDEKVGGEFAPDKFALKGVAAAVGGSAGG